MISVAYDSIEIVGFEGSPIVECEMVLPVGRISDTDRFFRFDSIESNGFYSAGISDVQVPFFNEADINSLAQEGRLTLLARPFRAHHRAMIAYIDDEFRTEAEITTLPSTFQHQRLDSNLIIVCDSAESVESQLNEWAERLLTKATISIESYLRAKELKCVSYAERLTDLALCAATDHMLRARIYLRAGLALALSERPERLDNLYELTLKHEFPRWTWEGFKERLSRLIDVLNIKGDFGFEGELVAHSGVMDMMQLGMDAEEIEITEERYAESKNHADAYRKHTMILDEWVERVARVIAAAPKVRLDKDILRVIMGDAAYYYAGDSVIARGDSRGSDRAPLLRSDVYLKVARKLIDLHLDPGDVAQKAITQYVHDPIVT